MEFIQIKENKFESKSSNQAIKQVLDFIQDHDISKDQKGSHKITEDFFYNIIEMETTTPDNRVWESHREYYDIHLILEGQERISYNSLSNLNEGEYIAEEDYQKIDGNSLFDIQLSKNYLLFLDPNDGHKTGLMVNNQSEPLRKVVFKVKI